MMLVLDTFSVAVRLGQTSPPLSGSHRITLAPLSPRSEKRGAGSAACVLLSSFGPVSEAP